jgi:glutamate--cysteine ligase
VLREVDQAEGYIASICFKTGPPVLVGVELEWTVHHVDDPARPLDIGVLCDALGVHAPPTLRPDTAHQPLPGGSAITAEPGGQVEISSPPSACLAALYATVSQDLGHLTDLLGPAGLRLGEYGLDPHRAPRRLLCTPRYDAMARAFDRQGPYGRVMMCSTAGLQVCLHPGPAGRLAEHWAAMHALGPVLLATFATSARYAGRDTGWACARMRSWLGMDPARTAPVGTTGDPARAWARYALAAPVLCVRRPDRSWHAPPGVTFADWIAGTALPEPPTVGDLDYHLTTLFPPVRPRGYVELRYLDAQPPRDWFVPVAVVTALLHEEATVDAVLDECAPVAGRWIEAARSGLADPALARAAGAVLDLAGAALDRIDLPAEVRADVTQRFGRRLTGREGRAR